MRVPWLAPAARSLAAARRLSAASSPQVRRTVTSPCGAYASASRSGKRATVASSSEARVSISQ